MNGHSTGGYMRFPLKTSYGGTTIMTPYQTRVVAVQDHNPDPNSIVAYNGETGLASYGPPAYDSGVYGYLKDLVGSAFNLPLLTYDDGVAGNYLFYETASGLGHTGYDFAPNSPSSVTGKPIQAAEHGILCAATTNTAPGSGIWRRNETGYCQLLGIPSSNWASYRAVYIVHDKWRSGTDSFTDQAQYCFSTWMHNRPYVSVYMHMEDYPTDVGNEGLESSIRSKLINDGYARVKKGQVIGYVGGYPNFGDHLHFGFRLGCDHIDPYGPGTGDSNGNIPSTFRVLWEAKP